MVSACRYIGFIPILPSVSNCAQGLVAPLPLCPGACFSFCLLQSVYSEKEICLADCSTCTCHEQVAELLCLCMPRRPLLILSTAAQEHISVAHV